MASTVLIGIAAGLAAGLIGGWLAARAGRGAFDASLATLLDTMRQQGDAAARQHREEIAAAIDRSGQSAVTTISELVGTNIKAQNDRLEAVGRQLQVVADGNEQRLESLRGVVDAQLKALQEANTAKLEEIRKTVGDRLEATLDQRLGQSFKLVSDRLEAVHKGLGEMQILAAGVGDLKRVLANVKTRGTWGETQLQALLDQVLTPDQYATNVRMNDSTNERVEFAIKFPGRGDTDEPLWLPIDSKFPLEDYERLIDSSERGDIDGVEAAVKALEARVKACAKDIHTKYINPPNTTDVAILYVPTEGLYAEIWRRPGLADFVQREYRIMIAGPSTLSALLNSLQMGFRTLAIQKRSSEVWHLLGKVKGDFSQFGKAVDAVHKKLEEASNKIEDVRKGSRRIEKTLKNVQDLNPTEEPPPLELRPPEPESEADLDEEALV